MPAKDLGTKHVCFKCSTKFYDLKKEPICPKCGSDQRQIPAVKSPSEKRARAPARPAAPLPVEETEVEAELEEVAEADEAEEEVEETDDEA
jgi:uncharacterized protein (TIGR02300 family)